MGRQRTALNTFNGGEVSPNLKGRADLALYDSGMELCENWLPQVNGGIKYRTGTKFKKATFHVRPDLGIGSLVNIQPFVFNNTEKFLIEYAHQHARVYKDGDFILGNAIGAITAIVNGIGDAIITKADHGLFGGDEIFMDNINGVTNFNKPDGPFRVVTTPTKDTFTVFPKASGTFTSSPSSTIEKVTALEAPLTDTPGPATAVSIGGGGSAATVTIGAHILQIGDKVDIKHINGIANINNGFTVTIVTATTFSIADEFGSFTGAFVASPDSKFRRRFPYRVYTSDTLVTLLADPQVFEFQDAQIADVAYLAMPDHRPIQITRTSNTAWAWTNFIPTADPFATINNWPTGVAFHEQRLVFVATNNKPLTVFMSKAGNFDSFALGTADDDALQFTLQARKIAKLQWTESVDKFLIAGSLGGAFRISGGLDDSAITPTNISAKIIYSKGAAPRLPLLINRELVFVQAGQKRLTSLIFDIAVDGYAPQDLTKIADHILEGNVRKLAFQSGLSDFMWAIKGDTGELLGLTIDRDENVAGWSRHTTREGDVFESMAVLPAQDNFDELSVVIQRNIDGINPHYYLETFDNFRSYPRRIDTFTDDRVPDDDAWQRLMWEAQKVAIHLDSTLTYDGSVVTKNAAAAVTPDATTGLGVKFTTNTAFFVAGDVDRQIWNRLGNGRAIIKTFVNSAEVTCDIIQDFPTTDQIKAGDWYITAGSLAGLKHLEANVAQIVADGMVHPDQTVTGGIVTLEFQASVINVGLKYRGTVQVLPLEGGGTIGPSQGQPKAITRIVARLLNTIGLKIGTDIYELEKPTFRTTLGKMNRPEPLFTGDFPIQWPDGWEREKVVIFVQDTPLPATVQMLLPDIISSDG